MTHYSSGFTILNSLVHPDRGYWEYEKTHPLSPQSECRSSMSGIGCCHSLIQLLPSGTAFGIGVVLIVMMTGRLVHHKGSLARAVLPFVVHLHWGWHRVERAMARGKVVLDPLFDHAFMWCVANLPVEPVRLGEAQREMCHRHLDYRPAAGGCPVGPSRKGFCHRAGRAVRANLVAAATSIVMIGGVRVGLVRRTRFGARCEEAVETSFMLYLPVREAPAHCRCGHRDPRAVCGRHGAGRAGGALRINCKLRRARPTKRHTPPSHMHGPVSSRCPCA